jgi:branched-chain amino acid transport system substrate-binding protein
VRRVAIALAALALPLGGVASGAGGSSRGQPVVVRGCDRLYYERDGRPQLIVVSELPLEDSAHTAMNQMTQAIKLMLKDDGFRAGSRTVGYEVCDDSGRAGSSSAKQCRAGARAAARVPNVVGVIGTLDSACARVKLPILGAAKLALVSPLNTATDLTRSHRATVLRLSAPDDAQAAVAARFVRASGARAVAVLSDGTARGDEMRTAFAAAASGIGLRTVERGRADAAFVAGLLSSRTRGVLRAARRLAPVGPLVLSAGFGPVAQLAAEVGTLAEDAYLVVAGVPIERLGGAGRRFVARFESAFGTSPHPYAVYAAQAARILLDAIAASNGTRQSVARAVLATKIERGLIGPLSFDANGDPIRPPVTIFRVRGRRAELVRVEDSAVP